jgi:hypothetical protein
MKEHEMLTEINDGEVRFWIEQGENICMKAVASGVDPVELTTQQAKFIAETLLKMVVKIEASQ